MVEQYLNKLDSILNLDSVVFKAPDFRGFSCDGSLCGVDRATQGRILDSGFIPKKGLFKRKVEILGIDFFDCVSVSLDKQDIVNSCLYEDFAIYQAHALSLVPEFIQGFVVTSDIYGEYVKFIVYFCENKHLLEFSNMKKDYFLDPFKLFSNIYHLDTKLEYFTLLIIDSKKQAICHYYFGELVFVCIKDRDTIIENFLSGIDRLGQMLRFSFSNEDMEYSNFCSTDDYFGIDRNNLISALVNLELGKKNKLICNKEFIVTRKILGLFMVIIFGMLIFFISDFVSNKLKMNNQEKLLNDAIMKEVDKKRSYTPMYDKIYEEMKSKREIFLHIKQAYIDGEWVDVLEKDSKKP